ncbi:hypothetical protein GGI01_002656 [Coemansia sp. RSA 376]|nr:hypothetical protein GGI01_002656 [Coemansia sp. RSA 376]
MDDVAAFSVTAAASAAAATVTVDSGLDDFGLIDYESPGPDPLSDMEEPEEPEEKEEEKEEESGAADGLINYEESDNDEPDTSIVEPTAFDVSNDHRMNFDDDEDAERLEQSLHDSHLSTAGEQEPIVTDSGLDDEALVRALMEEDGSEHHLEEEAETNVEVNAAAAATYSEQQQQQLDDTDVMGLVPETWVFSDGEWMIYLGPNQHSYGADYQSTLFAMPLDQLISALHADVSLGEDIELALEFPSLALTIDQRDGECADISLSQIYNCHIAAARLGRFSEDLVNSPYFSLSTYPTTLTFAPSPASFAFIIHTRPSVHSSLKRIMQIVAEDALASSHPVPVPQEAEEPEVVANGAVAVPAPSTTDKEPVDDITLAINLDDAAEEAPAATTADLLADAGEEEEDDDEDYVAEGEEEGDFVLEDDENEEEEEEVDEDDDDVAEVDSQDDDAVEVDDQDDVDDADGIVTHVESLSASPTHKRTQDSVVEAGDEVVPDCDAPAAKKPRSEDATVQDGDDVIAPLCL